MEETRRKKCTKCCFIPQRFILTLMLCLGVIGMFLLRISFGTVLKHIILKSSNATKIKETSPCNFSISDIPFGLRVYGNTIKTDVVLGWKAGSKQRVKVAFFYGYLVGNMPGGYLADKFGGKHVLGTAALTCAFLTIITPVVMTSTDEDGPIVAVRALMGIAQGAVFPSVNSLISCWTPTGELGAVSGVVFAATQFCSIINDVSTMTLLKNPWQYVFYIYGGAVVAWWALWMLLCHSNPQKSPFIRNKEEEYLKKELGALVTYTDKEIPWGKMLSSLPVWSLIVVQIGHTWIWHSMFSDMPAYMSSVMKFDLKKSYFFVVMPYGLMGICTILFGFLADFVINRKYVTRDTVRKTLTNLGAMGPGVFLVAATYSGCHLKLYSTLFLIAMVLMACYYAGTRVVTLELAPNYSGCIMGLANGLGALPGIVQPHLSRKITPHKVLNEWRLLFILALSVLAVSNIIFVLFGTSEEQRWNKHRLKKDK